MVTAKDHPAKTLLGDRVIYHDAKFGDHVAFVIQVNSEHNANLVYYCPHDHSWKEATSVNFGKREGNYFVNTEA